MIGSLRGRLGKYIIVGVISLIAAVFALEGFFFNRASRGGFGGTSVAGSVNGDAIALADYYRALGRTRESYRKYFGDKVSEEQLRMFGLEENTFKQLARGKVIEQDAEHKAIPYSVVEMKDMIRNISAFQKNSRFDPMVYKDVLAANGMSAGSFEAEIKRDLIAREWGARYVQFIPVSSDEVQSAFIASKNIRKFRFVRIPKSKDATLKARYVGWQNELGSANAKGLEGLEKTLKEHGLKVETSGLISKDQAAQSGLGADSDVLNQLFSLASEEIGANGKPRVNLFQTATETFLVATLEAKLPPVKEKEFQSELAKFRPEYIEQKRREVLESATNSLVKKAKIEMNPGLIQAREAGA